MPAIKRLPADLRAATRRTLARHAPQVLWTVRAWRFRRRLRRQFGSFQDRMQAKLYGEAPIKVLHGPFRGLSYVNDIVHGQVVCRWLGSYEEELHGIVETILTSPYAMIVNVGSAEGYYTVGLARAKPMTEVISFELDPWGRAQQRKLALLNRVENLRIGSWCSPETLATLAQRGPGALICDIEGAELQLLDPVVCPGLSGYDLLVEIHGVDDLPCCEVLAEMIRRFRASHRLEIVRQRSRDLAFYRDAVCDGRLTLEEVRDCLDEHRGDQVWLWMRSAGRSA
jgi:hypothetical protein